MVSGALLKAAFVCADIVDLKSSVSLERQLKNKYSSGFELHTWSTLPHGSGLGTSSILSGVVMAVLWRLSGKAYDMSCVIHSVSLHLISQSWFRVWLLFDILNGCQVSICCWHSDSYTLLVFLPHSQLFFLIFICVLQVPSGHFLSIIWNAFTEY